MFLGEAPAPLHLRDKVREGQRIEGHEIELFLVRPMFSDPAREIELAVWVKTRPRLVILISRRNFVRRNF